MGWAIYTDLSGVTEIAGANHPSEQAALEALILRLESDKTEIVDKIAKAKRRLRQLRRKKS